MTKKVALCVVLLSSGSLLSSCSNSSAPTEPEPSTTSSGPSTSTEGSLSDPKGSISYQLDMIKAGDADKLKACFTPRVSGDITPDAVEKAKGEAGKYTIEDLYASAEMGEAEGKKTAKVKMKNGRTLTTLIQTDGKWLSDTVWFK